MAFISASFIPAKRAMSDNRCVRHPIQRKPPTMGIATTIATELLSATALSGALYYFFVRDDPSKDQTKEKQDGERKPAQTGATLGLSGISPSATTPSPPQSPTKASVWQTRAPAAPAWAEPETFDSVGVNINDYLETPDENFSDDPKRLEEELKFAAEALYDIPYCSAILIIDSAGDVIWVRGDLVGDTERMGSMPGQVARSKVAESVEVPGNTLVPFLKDEVRSVAILPIGTQGAVLTIASEQPKFFGEMEERTAYAVCGRLSPFLDVQKTSSAG